MIVDTPGCGDMEQKEVADEMMSYLPNALAFVFVINVSNAGGLQDDRVPSLKHGNDFSVISIFFLKNVQANCQ